MFAHIDTVLFDLDGTLTVPVIDFDALRARLGTPPGMSLTHALNDLPEREREQGFEIVREAEIAAAQAARPNRGAIELVGWLHANYFATGIITRNFREAVDITLSTLGLEFDVILTRDCAPPKPAPDALLEALRRLQRNAATTIMVGDYEDDMQAGKAAGTLTCLVTNGEDPRYDADCSVPWPGDLLALLKAHK